VIEPTDQFQKFGKNLGAKIRIFKKSEKSDLNKKSDFLIFKSHDFFQPGCSKFL